MDRHRVAARILGVADVIERRRLADLPTGVAWRVAAVELRAIRAALAPASPPGPARGGTRDDDDEDEGGGR